MKNGRLMAGMFAGAGGLIALIIGAYQGDPTLQTAGLLLISNMMAFFVGEKNGQKTAGTQES